MRYLVERISRMAGPAIRRAAVALPVLGIVCWAGVSGATESEVRPERLGFEVLTHDDDASVDDQSVLIRYEGIIDYPMAENLAAIWAEVRGRYGVVVLQLNSIGGELGHTAQVVSVLKQIRNEALLKTLVDHGDRCHSACVLVFMQGEARIAGGSSSWTIHGSCQRHSNIPSPEATRGFLELLRDAGVSERFLCTLLDGQRLMLPGQFWFSGYELFHVHHAGIVTELLDPWRPELPAPPPFDPQIQSR